MTRDAQAEREAVVLVDQTVLGVGNPRANCWQACLAMITKIPLADVIDVTDPSLEQDWWQNSVKWARSVGFTHDKLHDAPTGYAIAVGYTSRTGKHAVIYLDGELWHDPHPSREGLRQENYFVALATIRAGQLKESE